MIRNALDVTINFIRNNKLKLFLTFILILIIYIYFQDIEWEVFFSNISNLRLEFFIISSIFAIGAFSVDGTIWYLFLKPLAQSEIKLIDVIGINFFSVMSGVIIPSGGAVDVAVKLKYVNNSTSLSYEKIFATILAVRIIFIMTLYPTMVIFVYLLIEFDIVTLGLAIGLLTFSFIILTLLLVLLIIIIAKVDFFNNKLVPLIFYPLKRYERIQKLQNKILDSSVSFANSFRLLNGSRKYWKPLLVFTGIFWLIRFLAMYYIFLIVRDFPFHIIVLASTLGSFTTMIPAFIPGMAGIRDIVQAEILRLSNDVNEVNLLTSLMTQVQNIVLFLLSTLIFFLIIYKISKRVKINE